MKHQFIAEIQKDGHLPPKDRLAIAELLGKFPGKKLRIEISMHRKRRTDAQNAYYFAVVIPVVTRMLRDFGNDVNEIDTHEYLKLNVMKLGKMVMGPNNVPQLLPGSSTEIPIDEWSDKMEMIRAWAAKEGTTIPLPGEYDGQT